MSNRNTSVPTNENKEDDVDVDNEIGIILIGDRFVGKTSFIFQFVAQTYSDFYMPSAGADHKVNLIQTHQDKQVQVKIWDTSGDVKTREELARKLYSLASGFIVMYDVTNIDSYNNVYHWMETLKHYALDSAYIVIIGNKCDLDKERQITKEEGMQMAACYNAKFMEISVKNNRNVTKTLTRMTTNICEKINKTN